MPAVVPTNPPTPYTDRTAVESLLSQVGVLLRTDDNQDGTDAAELAALDTVNKAVGVGTPDYQAIAGFVRQQPGTLVLPMTEATTLPVSAHRDALISAGAKLVLPEQTSGVCAGSRATAGFPRSPSAARAPSLM